MMGQQKLTEQQQDRLHEITAQATKLALDAYDYLSRDLADEYRTYLTLMRVDMETVFDKDASLRQMPQGIE